MAKKQKSAIKKKNFWLYLLLGLFCIWLFMPHSSKDYHSNNIDNTKTKSTIKPHLDSSSNKNEQSASQDDKPLVKNESNTDIETKKEQVFDQSIKNIDRGWVENRDEEPNYIGLVGYIGAKPTGALDNVNSLEQDWSVPYFIKDKNALIESGRLPNKTKFSVLNQDITHDHHGIYKGYLTILPDGFSEPVLVDVSSFVQRPWFELPLSEAAEINPYIATYNQRSDEYPVSHGEAYPDIPNGVNVIVDRRIDDAHVEGYIFTDWRLGFGGVKCSINIEDLDYLY